MPTKIPVFLDSFILVPLRRSSSTMTRRDESYCIITPCRDNASCLYMWIPVQDEEEEEGGFRKKLCHQMPCLLTFCRHKETRLTTTTNIHMQMVMTISMDGFEDDSCSFRESAGLLATSYHFSIASFVNLDHVKGRNNEDSVSKLDTFLTLIHRWCPSAPHNVE